MNNSEIKSISDLVNKIRQLQSQFLSEAIELDKELVELSAVHKHKTKAVIEAKIDAGREVQYVAEACVNFQREISLLADQIQKYIDESGYSLTNDITLKFQLEALASFIK
ncbi:hypothetical protein ACTJ2Z_000527 [Vibrio vulnificus]|jgi:DNA-binding protein H-NS|uniref:hypothetical protein n=1 Tax=Vibrio vulnificus TaxID=672 RepID=UPI001CDBADAE|nr:hypothetical protein [Vibrio vulnificus]MCA3937104.1 hypothetical protein [Vibrio vulnificus]